MNSIPQDDSPVKPPVYICPISQRVIIPVKVQQHGAVIWFQCSESCHRDTFGQNEWHVQLVEVD